MAADEGERSDLREAEIDVIRDPALVESRRNQILDASLMLFLQKGYAATTVRDICAASGVNQASLYDYIANKEDILRRLLNRVWFNGHLEGLIDRIEGADRDAPLADILAGYYRDTWRDRRDGILLAYRSVPHLAPEDKQMLRAREERLIGELCERIEARTGVPAADPRVRVISNFIIYLNAFGPFRDWLMSDEEIEASFQTIASGVEAMVRSLTT